MRSRRSARSSAVSRATCGSRTPRGCGIASPRSRRSRRGSTSSTRLRAAGALHPCARARAGFLARVRSSLAGASSSGPSRGAQQVDSRSRPRSRPRRGRSRRSRRRTRPISSSSPASCGSHHRSSASCGARRRRDPRRVAFMSWMPPTSPTASPRPSRASRASSSSGSTRDSTCFRWSCGARRCSAGPRRRRPSRASARGSWTRSARTSSP